MLRECPTAKSNSTVYLVSCVSKKKNKLLPAKDIYDSDWFQKARAYVESQQSPWFILSAEYGLVSPEANIGPYDKTLKTLPVADRRAWAQRVISQMQSMLPQAETVVLLVGMRYREFLMDYLQSTFARVEVPMENLRIGEQLRWLSQF